MNKQDIITIIAACSDLIRLDKMVKQFSSGIDSEEFIDLWGMFDVLARHMKEKDYDRLYAVISDDKLSADEKYELLM